MEIVLKQDVFPHELTKLIENCMQMSRNPPKVKKNCNWYIYQISEYMTKYEIYFIGIFSKDLITG
ncbi:hypothetical protein KGMB02408_00830 [Bacteroides faecalis]|uniref:Uncharacterized protein n=1 Tax=Bacteroides faecalis TaxID=2447885 RepID=A0A401LNM8_9BACE|nr:hypothetical protein KGMB02408_00830 [Bacteroides faecalis]